MSSHSRLTLKIDLQFSALAASQTHSGCTGHSLGDQPFGCKTPHYATLPATVEDLKAQDVLSQHPFDQDLVHGLTN